MPTSKYLFIICCILILGCSDDQKDSDKASKEDDKEQTKGDWNTQYLADVRYSLSSINQNLDKRTHDQMAALSRIKASNPSNLYIPFLEILYKDLEKDIDDLENLLTSLDNKIAMEASMENIGNYDIESTNRFIVNDSEGLRLESKLTALNKRLKSYALRTQVAQVVKTESLDYSADFLRQFIEKFSGNNAEFNLEKHIRDAPFPSVYFDESTAESWLEYRFKDVPALGARTIFIQLKMDLNNLKFHLLSSMVTTASGSTMQRVIFYPVVSTNKSFFNLNEPVNVTINVGSYDPDASVTNDSTRIPEFYQGTYTAQFQAAINARDKILADGGVLDEGAKSVPSFSGWPFIEPKRELAKTPDGSGIYTEIVKGDKTIQGAMYLDGVWYDWQTEYKLETSGDKTYQLDKLKIMFAGVTNPITVSMGAAQVTGVSCSWGKVKKIGNGKYEITPKSVASGRTKELRSLTAKGIDQGIPVSQEFTFEVRDFPPPTARHKGAKAGDTELTRKQVGEFKNGISTIVATPDDNSLASLFDAKFKVVDFEIAFQMPGDGQYIVTPDKIGTMAGKLEGATLTIRKIKAIDPSGKKVDLDSRVYIVTK